VVTNQDMYFSWVNSHILAGCRAPWRDPEIQFLRDQGIQILVRLQESKELRIPSKALESLGIVDYHCPIAEGAALPPQETQLLIEFLQQSIDRGKPVAVSCGGGIGRTGTILACYLVAQDISAEQAIRTLRKSRGPSLETKTQEAAVYAYEQFLNP
jgi:atypical dual specificity phosphatase